jgi:hypothetical protein
MKTSIKLLGASVLMLAASTAFAEPAIILTDFGCGMIDGDGGDVFTTDTKVVSSLNNDGSNINLKCHASDIANSTGTAVKWNYENTGSLCGTQYGSTEDWRIVVDTEGNATMTCKLHY